MPQNLQGRSRHFFPALNRGLWFDLGILAANCWLVPALTGLAEKDGQTNPAYAAILLISMALNSLGAFLKRAPLQARRMRFKPPPAPLWALIALFVLLIMQFALWVLSGSLALGLFGQGGEQTRASILPLLAVLGLSVLPLGLTIRALLPVATGLDPLNGPLLARREALADTALYLSAVVSLSIWDGMVMADLAGHGPYHWAAGLLLMILITVPYAMFYAAPRILLLAEDYRSKATWLRLAVVMMPLSIRLLL